MKRFKLTWNEEITLRFEREIIADNEEEAWLKLNDEDDDPWDSGEFVSRYQPMKSYDATEITDP